MSPAGSKNAPEAKAREKIDALLAQAGWLVQDREDMNLTASDGIAVREFKLEKGHGFVDYLLFVDGNALGVVEAKPAGYSFTSVEFQAKKYVEGLPASLTAPQKPLPFAYISTGEETVFINTLDPQPRSRPVFTFHRPETLREWLTADTLDGWLRQSGGFYTRADDTKPSTLRARLRAMPPVELPGLWRVVGQEDPFPRLEDHEGFRRAGGSAGTSPARVPPFVWRRATSTQQGESPGRAGTSPARRHPDDDDLHEAHAV